MKILVLTFGKTASKPLSEMESEYLKKASRFCTTELICIKEPAGHTKLGKQEQIKNEAIIFESKLAQGDLVISLDEKGKQYSSVAFSDLVRKNMGLSFKRMVFIIGGPYGISEELKKRSDMIISLSSMTFTHEMARVLILEQVYRALSIINNSPYHHN